MTKILLVEDHEINRDMLLRRLKRKGYEVVVAVDGREAVAKAQSDRPDLILMDLHLPVMDGWEATRRIKANLETQTIPVIALTADALAGEREKAIAAGCDDYDTKPVNLPQLLQKIEQQLQPEAEVPTVSHSEVPDQPDDRQLKRRLQTALRRDLDPPLYSIIGYSDLLLVTIGQQRSAADSFGFDSNLFSDLRKLFDSGMQLLDLIHGVLNPALASVQQQEVDILAPTLQLELRTPLSTIMGYCEMLLEEAPVDYMPDLERIHGAAQDLLIKVNGLDDLAQQHIRSIQQSEQPSEADASSAFLKMYRLETCKADRLTLGSSRILVVDVNPYSRALVARQLEAEGCRATVVMDCQQAVEAIASRPYDLILLEAGGLDLLEQLKQNPDWQHIPVLLMVAPDDRTAVIRGLYMGATDYLVQPFQTVMLRKKVDSCLMGHPLSTAQRKFSSPLEDAPIGIYRVTFESLGEKTVGRFASANSALISLLGYSTAAELISSVKDIASEIYADPTQYSQFVGLLKDVGQVTGFEYQGYRQSGDLIWISQSAWAIRDGRGALVGYEGILEEVTERKLAELTLAQTVEDLKKEIFHLQQVQQAADIVQTDYFQKLRSNGEEEKPQTVAPKANLPTRVLLVEDNELNRDMLSRRLKRANYEVSVAMDGAEGTDKAMQELPDIILMDISLPVMDGWEATQRLKQDPQTAKIPIIALTAHAMAGDREKSLAAGCDDYDTKPIDLSRLLSKIEGCLQCSTR